MLYRASVIIPVYNAEAHLRRCVESIALGKERNLEIILIDDCSQDQSWRICQELEQEFTSVTAIHNDQNIGVSATRNRGLDQVHGKFILFVDSDDWVSAHYAEKLLEAADCHPDALPICGLHFINKVQEEKRDYIWDDNGDSIAVLNNKDLITLAERFLLQQLWNKVFRADMLQMHQIRFDDSLRMGEDYKFILDYVEATGIQQFFVLKEPLYYYLRWNNSSLMNNFGFLDRENEYERTVKLYELSGIQDPRLRDDMLNRVKQNYVYQISRNSGRTLHQKLDAIESVMQDQRALSHYCRQFLLAKKENTGKKVRDIKKLFLRAGNRFKRKQRDAVVKAFQKELTQSDYSLISQNCIGGVVYHDAKMEFLSPTINLFFRGDDFVKFVLQLEHYLSLEPVMEWDETYPIGYLESIRIDFMHYDTCAAAKDSWERRKARINWDRIVVLCTDMEGFSKTTHAAWEKIPYPKLLFTADPSLSEDENAVFYPEYSKNGHVPDLIPNREFYKDGRVVSLLNHLD